MRGLMPLDDRQFLAETPTGLSPSRLCPVGVLRVSRGVSPCSRRTLSGVYLFRTLSAVGPINGSQRSETGFSRHGTESRASTEERKGAVSRGAWWETPTGLSPSRLCPVGVLRVSRGVSPCSRRTLSGVYLFRTLSAVGPINGSQRSETGFSRHGTESRASTEERKGAVSRGAWWETPT